MKFFQKKLKLRFLFGDKFASPNWILSKTCLNNLIWRARACVCMRACVHACACVFLFFHCGGFFRLQNVQDIREGTGQRSCVVNISWLRYAKFYHLCIWKCHISPPKTKTSAETLLERKRYIMCIAKRYILI